MTQTEINKGNELIAKFMGYEYYPNCKSPKWFYECEISEWEHLDTNDVWVKGATELFKETPCVSQYYWEMERDINEKQWEEWHYGLKYHEKWDWLMPVVEKIEAIRWIPPRGDDENYFMVCIDGDQCSVDRETHNSSSTIVDNYMGDKPKIQRVYEVVIEFIQWYNKEK